MVKAVGTNLDKFFGPGAACGPWPKKVRTTARPKSERKNAIGFISPSLQMNVSRIRPNLRTKRQRLKGTLDPKCFLSAATTSSCKYPRRRSPLERHESA